MLALCVCKLRTPGGHYVVKKTCPRERPTCRKQSQEKRGSLRSKEAGHSGRLLQIIYMERLVFNENDKTHSHSQSQKPNLGTSALPEMMLLPSLMKSMLWQVMLWTVIRSSSLLDSVCHTLMSSLAQVANSSAVPLKRSPHKNKRCNHKRCSIP